MLIIKKIESRQPNISCDECDGRNELYKIYSIHHISHGLTLCKEHIPFEWKQKFLKK
jgi:hypothetical protein